MSIEKLIRVFIAAVVLVLLGWCAKMLIAALGGPAILWTIVIVLLVLVFILFICKEFGVFS
jgi:hypothetical protein